MMDQRKRFRSAGAERGNGIRLALSPRHEGVSAAVPPDAPLGGETALSPGGLGLRREIRWLSRGGLQARRAGADRLAKPEGSHGTVRRAGRGGGEAARREPDPGWRDRGLRRSARLAPRLSQVPCERGEAPHAARPGRLGLSLAAGEGAFRRASAPSPRRPGEGACGRAGSPARRPPARPGRPGRLGGGEGPRLGGAGGQGSRFALRAGRADPELGQSEIQGPHRLAGGGDRVHAWVGGPGPKQCWRKRRMEDEQASRVTAPSIYTYVERRFGGWPHVVLDGAPFAHG